MVERTDTELLTRITDDWDRWVHSRRGSDRRARWTDRYPVLSGWSPDELRTPTGGARADAMQAALVALAQDGEPAAATTLVVQFRPALARLARRRQWSPSGGSAVVATFIEVVLAHDLDRRPRRIAGNLVLDTRQRLDRSSPPDPPSPGSVAIRDLPESFGHGTAAGADGPGHPTARWGRPEETVAGRQVVGAVAATLAALPGNADSVALTREVAFRAWFLDEPTAVIADDLGLGREAVRTRLCRLRTAVRRHPGLAA